MAEIHHPSHTAEDHGHTGHDGWDPKIVGFLCNWCSYAGADLCGVSRYQYPSNIRVIRVMCSAMLSPHIILELLRSGADGILLGGCHIGDCHYISGNLYTEKRIKMIRKLLERAGLEPERLRLEWISASEGERFSRVVSEFTKQIELLGPSKARTDANLSSRMAGATSASETFRVLALVGKELNLTNKGNAYNEKLDPKELERIIENATGEEFERSLILELAKDIPRSVKDLGRIMGVPTDRVLKHIVALRQRNLITMEHPEGFTPTYRTIEIGEER